MIIDFHVHCNTVDSSEISAYASLCRANDTKACLMGGLLYGSGAMTPNETVLEICKKYPDVFIPAAKVDLWDSAISSDCIFRLAESGFRALKFIYPYYEYDHDMYMNVYEAAEKAFLPCVFHTGMYSRCALDVSSRRPILKNMHPLTLDRIARSFQKLNIVMAHLGTVMFREEAAGLLWLHDNIYFDLAGNGSYQELSACRLRELLNPYYFIPDESCSRYRRMIFGSDAFIGGYQDVTQTARRCYDALTLEVPQEIRDGIMGGTVSKWLSAQ